MKIKHNIARLKHLLKLYRMEVEDLLVLISEGLKHPIQRDDLFSDEIDLNHLKRIDKVFQKGINYYLDPSRPTSSNERSIFFRKQNFEVDLNLGSKKIVNHFEEYKFAISGIAKLADVKLDRVLPVYNINHSPKDVARSIRSDYNPTFHTDLKTYLKNLITLLSEINVFVFEFVETWNQKETANLDGFFIKPNIIVVKRQQASFRREIFTLTHELGHYLIAEEEIDDLSIDTLLLSNPSAVERWCNDFAYYFLVGEYDAKIDEIETADATNDYCHAIVTEVSRMTHLSRIALFTRLLYQGKISRVNYNYVQEGLTQEFIKKQEEKRRKKELDKELGAADSGRAPKPIQSPLLISTIQTAYHEGVIDEYEVAKQLNIEPARLNKYIQ